MQAVIVNPVLEDDVERLLDNVFAHDRLAEALHLILVDGLGPCPAELPEAQDRDWLRAALVGPIQRATDAALRELVRDVAVALSGAPPGLLDRLEHGRRWGALGYHHG